MKRLYRILLVLLVLVIMAVALWWFFGRGNTNALWQIVSQQCVPNQQQHNDPAPCLTVNLAERYVLFKDSKGPYHDLVMPTDKLSGIESPELENANAPPYFALAWENRGHITQELAKPIKDTWLSLAINSKYGRSQNQLHIHIACLRPDVYDTLREQTQHIDNTWKPLAEKLVGHQYIARKLSGLDLTKEDPIKLLQQYVSARGDSMANYGLALVVAPEGERVLLANRLKITDLNLGSAGELQDYQCALANN
ncbi:CDP-diacylglycerol diphosphatase [Serratia sp. NPDC078593]|uniref:CDP-diacylglycerol diphosphatase n=1 Tax=unclassified Serratia (in: enterobacteria) TaxID=2647522 RepID=UPI0037D04ABE